MTAPAASPTASRPGTLLLVGVLGFGHFPVYANNLTLWALSRGIGVVYAGLCQPDNFYVRKFADHPGVCFCPLAGLGFAEFSGRAETDANLALAFRGALAGDSRRGLCALFPEPRRAAQRRPPLFRA